MNDSERKTACLVCRYFFFLIAFNPQLVGCANVEPVGTRCRLSHWASSFWKQMPKNFLCQPILTHPEPHPWLALLPARPPPFPTTSFPAHAKGRKWVTQPAHARGGHAHGKPWKGRAGVASSSSYFLQFCNFPNCSMSGPALEFDSVWASKGFHRSQSQDPGCHAHNVFIYLFQQHGLIPQRHPLWCDKTRSFKDF